MKSWNDMTPRERDFWVDKYVLHREPCGYCPKYSTSADVDYRVLRYVRETWDESALRSFTRHFHAITRLRAEMDGQRVVFALMYEPGDYSHAAYLTLQQG